MTHAQQLRDIADDFASGVVGANTAGKLRQIAAELEALKAVECNCLAQAAGQQSTRA